jgi:hypothetical protein
MNLNSILIGSENPQGLRDYYNTICGKPAFEEVDKLKAAGATVVREPYQPGGAPEMGSPLSPIQTTTTSSS